MARKRKELATGEVIPADLPLTGDVVPDGDYAGMRYVDVLTALAQDMEAPLHNVSVEAAGAATDMLLANVLAVTQEALGDQAAKEAALRFCETCLPYALVELPSPAQYGAHRKLTGK